MALMKCPECGKENVSDTALTCPECGFNIKQYIEEKKQEQLNKEKEEKEKQEKQAYVEQLYTNACHIQENAKDLKAYRKALDTFNEIKDYKDSQERINICSAEITKFGFIQKKRIKICSFIVIGLSCVLLIGFLAVNFAKYRRGIGLYNSGAYDEALEQFEKVKVFNSASYIQMITLEKNYLAGVKYEENGNYTRALECFSKCGDYKDSKDRISMDKQLEKIQNAERLMEEGRLEGARSILEGLPKDIKATHPEILEYLELIEDGINSGWGGRWGTYLIMSDDAFFIDAHPFIKNKELYVRFTEKIASHDVDYGSGKVSGNKVILEGEDYTPELISKDKMKFIGELERISDYTEPD